MTRARDVADLQSGAVEFSSTISLTDSDVAHGMTGILPTATYGQLAPESGTEGGVRITTATEGATAYSVTATSTTPSTDGNGAVFRFRASKKSGTSEQALADTDDLMTIGNVGVEKVFIQGSGNIGINASPISYANAQATLFLQDDSNPAIGISDTGQSKDYFIVANGSRLGIVYGDGSNSGSFSNSTEIASFNNNGRVGLGTDNPSTNFVVSNGTEEHQVAFASGEVYLMARNQSAYITQEYIANVHVFTGYGDSSSNEAMRIDSSGNFLVGKTSASGSTAGAEFRADGRAIVVVDDNYAGFFARQSNDGEILRFLKDTTTVGIIGCGGSSSQPVIGSANTSAGGTAAGLRFDCANNSIQPWNVNTNALVDDTTDLGFSSMRFDDVFATNGTIQTSDENEKQDIASMTTAELAVGKRLSTLFKTFRWKSKVTEKADKARTHSGIVAQQVKEAFEAEGLDATKYALFCSDTWWEKEISVDAVEADEEKGIEAKDAYTYIDNKYVETEGYSEKTRLGVRYPELLSFIASYNESRFTAIEARLTALEK